MSAYDLEGADRVTTVGASDITMRIWMELEAAGEEGLTRAEVLERVGPHINPGYARRRYLRKRRADYEYYNSARPEAPGRTEPVWDTTQLEPALKFVVTKTLDDMRKAGSVTRAHDNRYLASREPRHRDPTIIDMTGDRTRLHMNSAEALRVLKPALERHDKTFRAQLSKQEWKALKKLIALHEEQMRLGFPNVP